MLHGAVFPSADWGREDRAVAVFGALRAHIFGQYNLTCFIKGSKVTTAGGTTPGNDQSPSKLCDTPELCHCRITILPS